MQESNALVLEILKLDNALKMSLYEQKEQSSTLRHYSQAIVSFPEIIRLYQEVISILNRTNTEGVLDPELVRSLSKAGQLLWDHLLTPSVKNKLKSTQISDLVLFIDEELINIPWELLYDGTNFLCLIFNIGRIVRTKKEANTVQYRSFSSCPKMMILANPTNDLKSAYLEGLNIKNQFDRKRNSIHIDFKSTFIEKMYVKKNLRDYDIVHFAGHCEYEPQEPQESGWIFQDGKFNIKDIQNMGSTTSLPSLIFSNSCYSAMQQENLVSSDYQESIYTLAQAFLFAGVRHYIGSIRKIEDAVSFTFAKEFYSQLISGSSLGESVRLARLKLIREYGIMSIGWTSYLLYGDPNFILFRKKISASENKLKKRVVLNRKKVGWLAAAVFVISIFIFLYLWLPSLNPSSYYLLRSTKNKFLAGNNQEVVAQGSRIISKDPLFLEVYPILGDTYYRLGDWENAFKSYFDYVIYSEQAKDNKHLVSAYIGLGWIYHLRSEHKKALEFYDKALILSRRENDRIAEADVLGKMAVWYMDKDDNDKALELLTKSMAINRERQNIYKHKYNLACDYFNLGLLFTNKDDLVTAKEFYEKSFAIFNKLKLNYELSDYYYNMGEIYSFQKEYLKAMECYQKGLKIDERINHKPNLAGGYDIIGELYLEMDKFREAENLFNQSIQISKEINALPELASAYHNLGILYKRTNKKSRAKEFLRQAQEIYGRIDKEKYRQLREEILALSPQ